MSHRIRRRVIGWRATLGAGAFRRRVAFGLTQARLAHRARLAASTVQRIEAGEEVGDEALRALAVALDCWPGKYRIDPEFAQALSQRASLSAETKVRLAALRVERDRAAVLLRACRQRTSTMGAPR